MEWGLGSVRVKRNAQFPLGGSPLFVVGDVDGDGAEEVARFEYGALLICRLGVAQPPDRIPLRTVDAKLAEER